MFEVSKPGEYVVVHDNEDGLKVMRTPNAADCIVVKRLQKGCVVNVTEIVELDKFRVRGKIDDGWISMIDVLDNNRYVIRKESEQISTLKVTT